MSILRTFSAKLWVFLTLATCSIALTSAWSVYAVARNSQTARLKSKLITLATTVARFMDPDVVTSLRSPEQQSSPEWRTLADQLLKFQENDPDIRYAYIMGRLPHTDRTGMVQFLVDPAADSDHNGDGIIDASEQAARLGDTYDAGRLAPAILRAFDGPACDDELTLDQWGASLSGYAPIRDHEGRAVGIVGVDIMADQLAALRRGFIHQCWIVGLAVVLTSLLVSSAVSWHISRPVKALHFGIDQIQRGNLDVRVTVNTRDEFHRLAEAFNAMTEGLKERDFIRTTLNRYMGKELAEVVLRRGEAFFNIAERRRLTVLFCDIRGMTTISEQLSPEETVRILTQFFEHMIEAVFRHGGIVDKLLGDGLMALFGAPLDMADHEEAAVRCAIDMVAAMDEVRKAVGIPDLSVGVGINTGSVVAGNVGSGRMIDYTVIGDAANVAARLQQETRTLDVMILISQATAEPLRNRIHMRLLGPIPIRGRTEPVVVYSVEGAAS